MNDVEYILRIVLKARDDMAAVLNKARQEIRGFARDANSMNTAVTNLNQAMENFDGKLKNVTDKLEAWRATLRETNDDGKALAKTIDQVGKNADASGKKIRDVANEQAKLAKSADKLRNEFLALSKVEQDTDKKREGAILRYREIGRELESLAKKAKDTTIGTFWARWSNEARDAATSVEAATKAEKEHNDMLIKTKATQDDLVKSANKLRDEYREISKAEQKTDKDREAALIRLRQIGAELSAVSKNVQDASTSKLYVRWAADAKLATDAIQDVKRAVAATAKEQEAAAKATAKAVKEQDDLIKSANKLRDEYKEISKAEQKTDRDRAAAIIRLRQIGAELSSVAKKVDDASTSKLYTNWAADSKLAIDAIQDVERATVDANRRQKASDDAYAKAKQDILDRREAQAQQLALLARESARIEREGGSPAEVRKLAAGYDKLSGSYRIGSIRAREYANEAERIRETHRSSTGDVDRHGSALGRLSQRLGHAGKSAAGFDNQMRGTGILFAVVSINELVSAAIALGGELVSLAGSAVMAGGALGGILAAGAAQALPVFALLAGAASRVKSVMEAFKQSQVLDRAKATDAEKAGQKSIDQANTLANAHDAVAAANDNLAESRDRLTQAQKEGTDQLEDLILAEKQAALAARGAALDVKSAQEALAEAIRTGADQLEIDQKRQALAEAKMSQGRAGVTAKRATRERVAAGGDVGNLESVKAAAKAVGDAEKAVEKANRGLDQAADKSDRAASTTMSAAANLNYLLSQLSPAERKLYEAFTGLYDNYKRIFQGTSEKDGIYGVITDSFTRAVNKVNDIIQMPDVIKTISDLSGEIAKQINKILDSFTTPEGIDQLQGFMENATENLGPVVDMAIDLGHAFMNISTAANPALQSLLEYLGKIVDKFLALTENEGAMGKFFDEGEEHLESWLDLLFAIIGLFAELTGSSAESGKKSIDDLTEKIKTWTDWLADHREEVVGFFEDAREATYKIGGVLENLAVTLFKTFTPDRVDDLTKILNEVLIPALAEVMDVLGKITDAMAAFIDNPVLAKVAKWATAFVLFSGVANAVVGVFAKIISPIARFAGWAEKAVAAGGRMGKILTTFGKLGGRAIPFIGWGLAIAGLLHQFGLLDDAWDEIKQAAGALWGQIEPPLKRFMESFQRLIDAVKEGEGAFGPIIWAVREFLEILVEVAGFLLEGFAKAIGQVIGGIIDILGGLIDIITGILTGDFSLVWEGIKDIILGIANTIIGLVQIIFFRGIGRGLKALWGALKGLGKDVALYVGYGFLRVVEIIGNAFKSGAELGLKFIKGLPKAIWEIAKDIASLWWRGNRRLGLILREGIENGWKWIKGLPGRMWELAKDVVSFFWRGYRNLGRLMREGIESAWNWIKRLPSRMWELAKDVVSFFWRGYRNIGKMLRKGVEDVWDWMKGLPKRLGDIAKDAVSAFANAFKGLGKLIGDAISGGVKGAGNIAKTVVNSIMKFLETVWNKSYGGMEIGAGPLKFKIPELKLPRLAIGGMVPGTGDGDTVPAMLTPGEHVLTKAEVKAAGGHAAIFALRRSLGGGGQGGPFGFAPGGAVYDERAGAYHGGGTATQDDSKEREAFKKSTTERATNWRVMWNDMLTTTRRFANDIEKQFRDMRANTSKSAERMYHDVRGSLADIEHSFDVRGDRIADSWADTWASISKVTHEGLNYIGHETNKALTAMGEKHINFNLAAPKKEDGKAVGGWIGNQGERGKDRGLFPLGRGEAVLNFAHQPYVESALQAQYGFGLGGLFNHVKGFHAGGPGQQGFAAGKLPDVLGSKPGFAVFMALFQKLFGKDIYTMSGFRGGSRVAGSGNISNHASGNAVDISNKISQGGLPSNPPPQNALDRLHAFIAKNIAKPPMRDFLWRTTQGGNHFNHIHLGLDPSVTETVEAAKAYIKKHMGKVVDFGEDVKRRLVTPKGHALARLVQAVHDKTRKAANKKIGETVPDSETGGKDTYPAGVMSQGQVESTIRKALGILNMTKDVGKWVTTLTRQASRESSFNPKAVNNWDINAKNGDPSKGLIQIIGSNFRTYMEPGHGNILNPLDNVLAVIKYTIARYGGGNASRAVNTLWARGGGAYAAGGIVPGGEGSPVPILAHAGEWVLNKGQQLRAAMLSGLTPGALKSMLGFYGGGGAFAGGGDVKITKPQKKRITAVMKDVEADLGDDIYQNVAESIADLKRVARGITKVGKITKAVQPILDLIELNTKEGGFLDQLRESIERRFERVGRTLRRDRIQVGAGRKVIERQDDIESAQATLAATRRMRTPLLDERREIRDDLDTVKGKFKGVKKGTKLYENLQARQKELEGRWAEADERVLANQEDILKAQEDLIAAQEAAAKARLEAMQDSVEAAKKKITSAGNLAERMKRIATAVGFGMEAANAAIENNLNNSITALSAELAKAKAGGFTDIAAELEEEIADLQVQVTELAQQKIRDAIEEIGKAATRRNVVLDLFGRMADAMGVVGNAAQATIGDVGGFAGLGSRSRAQVAQGRIDSATTERAGYADQLAKLDPRNTILSDELKDKINELTVVIAENTRAAFDAKVAAVNTSHDYRQSIIDLDLQLVELDGTISGSVDQTKKSDLLKAKGDDLLIKGQELSALLLEATPGTQPYLDLEKAIKENEIATKQNTIAVKELTGQGSEPTSYTSTAWEWFRSALLTGTGGVMPQYTAPTMQSYSSIGPSGTSSTTNNGNTIVNNFEINEVGQPIDTTALASTVVFAQSTAS